MTKQTHHYVGEWKDKPLYNSLFIKSFNLKEKSTIFSDGFVYHYTSPDAFCKWRTKTASFAELNGRDAERAATLSL